MVDLNALAAKIVQTPNALSAAEKYAPCRVIIDADEAAIHLQLCVRHLRLLRGDVDELNAYRMERAKIGYFAGGEEYAIRQRIETLYHCVHPFSGAARDKERRRPIHLGQDFATMVAAWDTQSPQSSAFGSYAQPTWDLTSQGRSGR